METDVCSACIIGSKGSTFRRITPQKCPKRYNNRDCNNKFSSDRQIQFYRFEAKNEVKTSLFEDLLSRFLQSEAQAGSSRLKAGQLRHIFIKMMIEPRCQRDVALPHRASARRRRHRRSCIGFPGARRPAHRAPVPQRARRATGCLIFECHCALQFVFHQGLLKGRRVRRTALGGNGHAFAGRRWTLR